MNAIISIDKVDTELKMPTEIYSRVVGYFRPVNQWNKGKREEFEAREYLKYDKEVTE